jgi:hypothetical protein
MNLEEMYNPEHADRIEDALKKVGVLGQALLRRKKQRVFRRTHADWDPSTFLVRGRAGSQK